MDYGPIEGEKCGHSFWGGGGGVGEGGCESFTCNDFCRGSSGESWNFSRTQAAEPSVVRDRVWLAFGEGGGEVEYWADGGCEEGNGDGRGGV